MKTNKPIVKTLAPLVRKLEDKFPVTVKVTKAVVKYSYSLLIVTLLTKIVAAINSGLAINIVTFFTFIGDNGFILIGIIILTMISKIFLEKKDKTTFIAGVIEKIIDKLF